MYFRNCVEDFIIFMKVFYELNFKKIAMIFSHYVLIIKVIIDMNPISSFTFIV
jgi:hypothetical protein